jgi:hypothetical protein
MKDSLLVGEALSGREDPTICDERSRAHKLVSSVSPVFDLRHPSPRARNSRSSSRDFQINIAHFSDLIERQFFSCVFRSFFVDGSFDDWKKVESFAEIGGRHSPRSDWIVLEFFG